METRNETIIRRFKNGEIKNHLAKEYKISRQRIDQIISKRTYHHKKSQILIRDKYICQWCGKKHLYINKFYNIHHIDLNPNNNKDDNLITLCIICHKNFHLLEKYK